MSPRTRGSNVISPRGSALRIRPFLGGELARYTKLRVRGVDHDGEPMDIEVEDFTARIFQHEIDHTDGHVYLDRMPDLTTLAYTIVL
jgi:peptide deformylase